MCLFVGQIKNILLQLSAYDWLMLHDCYAQSSGANWREFFLDLGVTDFLAVKERAITITPTELVRAKHHALVIY